MSSQQPSRAFAAEEQHRAGATDACPLCGYWRCRCHEQGRGR